MAVIDSALINDLQDHFDGRGRLKKASMALRCYSKDVSIFFSYIDGFGKKQYVNLPIEPSDILPILERYINRIDGDIIRLTLSSQPIKIVISNLSELMPIVEDYKLRFPSTFTNVEAILDRLEQSLKDRLTDEMYDGSEDYHIEVCSDWQDKIYVFFCEGRDDESFYFNFKGVVKL